MRWIVAMFLIPVAAAAWEDPVGDQEVSGQADAASTSWHDAPDGWFPYVDLVAARLDEEHDEFLFSVEVDDLAPGSEPQQHSIVLYDLPFVIGDRPYLLRFDHRLDGSQTTFKVFRTTAYMGPTGFNFTQSDLLHEESVDPDGNTLAATAPRTLFLGPDQRPLRVGDVLRDAQPIAYTFSGPTGCGGITTAACLRARDTMAPQDIEIVTSPPGAGHLLLRSEAPYRGSNGAATTYIYDVELVHLDGGIDAATLQVDAPTGWTVRAPHTVEVDGEPTGFSVAVDVPFRHQHGVVENVGLRAVSQADPSVFSTLELGVIWHATPQPGGHHPTLYLHHDNHFTHMNTRPDPSGIAEPSLAGSQSDGIYTQRTFRFSHPLSPGLLVGLDFKPESAVTGRTQLELPEGGEWNLTARLMTQGDGEKLLAHQTQSLDTEEELVDVDWHMPVQDADRIPFSTGRNLVLEIDATHRSIDTGLVGAIRTFPVIHLEGNRFDLPLRDYHEIVDDDLASTVARLSLAPDLPERLVNPGETALVTFTLENGDVARQTIDWSLAGNNAEWARLSSPTTTVAGGGNETMHVIVKAPAEAQDGDEASLLLIGKERRGAEVFGRVLVIVTTTTDVDDQARLADAYTQQPEAASPGGPLLVALIAALLLRRPKL